MRRLVCTLWQQTKLDQVVVSLLTKETSGDTVAQKALTGTATLSHGLKAKALLHRSSANTTWKALLSLLWGKTSEVNSFLCTLEDWDLGRVTLSCHIALDMLCQEMREAGLQESLFSPWTGCDNKREGVR